MPSIGSTSMSTVDEDIAEQTPGTREAGRRRLLRSRIPLLILGVILFTGLLLSQDIGEVTQGIVAVGWAIVLISLYQALPLWLNNLGWWLLIAPEQRPGMGRLFVLRWIGQSVNNLLPVAQVGGELLRARLLAQSQPGGAAGASVLVDFTLGVLAQGLFTLAGVLMLLALVGLNSTSEGLLLGVLVALAPLLMFYLVQRMGAIDTGAQWVSRIVPAGLGASLKGGANTLDQQVRELYAQHGLILKSAFTRLAAWFVGVGEIWMIFHFMGAPVGLAEALALESVGYAARSLGFAIPGALGVVEGALVLVAGLLGINPADAMALAVVKRVRELLTGGPGLLAWYALERKG